MDWCSSIQIDVAVLFAAKIGRMFSFGMISVILIQTLLHKSLSEYQVSRIQSLVVLGDIFVSIVLTTQADRIGRKKVLILGAILKVITGIGYAYMESQIALIIMGILGIISVSGGQIGPFMPIQQSILTQLISQVTLNQDILPYSISKMFGYYNFLGYCSQALGAYFGGRYVESVTKIYNIAEIAPMVRLFLFYAILGGINVFLYLSLSYQKVEARKASNPKIVSPFSGLKQASYSIILNLSGLFLMDAWAGSFIVQSYLSYYFQRTFDYDYSQLGLLLFICNIISGISGIISSKLVKAFGAIATMVFTHLPSNIFLLLIPLANTKETAAFFLICRFCISQMDVPARQTYVSLVVSSQERSAANGITNIVRSIGVCIGLWILGYFMANSPKDQIFSYPFYIAGGTKILYDIILGLCYLRSKTQIKNEKFEDIEQMDLDLDSNKHQPVQSEQRVVQI